MKPGLASFAEDIAGVEAYLKPLLDFARESIPAEMIEYTPVMLGATAGMRIIPTQAQNSILAEVRRVFRESAFDFLDDNWARVISGQEEGAYMWLSVNYMLGTLLVDDVTRSSHVVDLGGASTQLGVVDGNSFTQNFLNVELPLSDVTASILTRSGYHHGERHLCHFLPLLRQRPGTSRRHCHVQLPPRQRVQ